MDLTRRDRKVVFRSREAVCVQYPKWCIFVVSLSEWHRGKEQDSVKLWFFFVRKGDLRWSTIPIIIHTIARMIIIRTMMSLSRALPWFKPGLSCCWNWRYQSNKHEEWLKETRLHEEPWVRWHRREIFTPCQVARSAKIPQSKQHPNALLATNTAFELRSSGVR